MATCDTALFWFRRDLRDEDNAGLHHALRSAARVHCVFVFDREILEALPSRRDRRVEFIHASVAELQRSLRARGGDLVVLHDRAREAIPAYARLVGADAVFANVDYEPAARDRDAAVLHALAAQGRRFLLAKDQAIFERDEVLSKTGRPYTVFTPYKRAWLERLDDEAVAPYEIDPIARTLAPPWDGSGPGTPAPMPTLASLGFERTDLAELGVEAGMSGARTRLADFARRIDRYREARDFPAVKGVSYLSVHNRFGTVSIRALARLARRRGGQAPAGKAAKNPGAETWLSELAWRDFYFQVLWHHPAVATRAFKGEFDRIEWPDDPALFEAWKRGLTGYPLVDAAMRQLSSTGFMHNRLRMVAASFLAKDLLVDWRRGERWFAEQLLDFDLAANNGGWQWAASTGCDAQPYFRIFNPVAQSEKFDPEGRFIRRYVPELARVPTPFVHAPWTMDAATQREAGCLVGRDYPAPVVDHAAQRPKALALYGLRPAKIIGV